jgi:hypothetical protein
MPTTKMTPRKFFVFVSTALFLILAVGVSVAFASLTFNGNGITGDTGSSLDATGTVTIGASQATGVQIGNSGITVTFPGSVTISGSTTTLQNLVVSGSCVGCGSGNFTAAGDLSGSSTSQTVIGIEGRAVSSTAPSANQVLTWNGTSWVPENTGSGITAINGLSNGTTSIVGAGGITISTSSPNVITISGTSGSITINNLATTTFQVVGTPSQITVASSAPNLITLSLPQNIGTTSTPIFGGIFVNGNATTTNLAITGLAGTGGCLSVSATGQVTTSTCSGGGGGIVTLDGITSSTFAFAAGNGLSVASSANPNTITYSFVNPGYVTAASSVTWTAAVVHAATTTFASTTIFSYLASSGSPCLTVSATGAVATTTCGTGSGIVTINGFTTSTFSIAAGSNITISTSSPNVITISASGGGGGGVAVSGSPSANQVAVFSASSTITGISVGSNEQVLTSNGTTVAFQNLPAINLNGLANPTGNATFNVGTNQFTFDGFSNTGGTASIFTVTDSATDTSAGYAVNANVALGSTLNPLFAGVNGSSGLMVTNAGITETNGILNAGQATTTNLAITGLAGTGGCLSVSASGQVTTSTCSGGGGGGGSGSVSVTSGGTVANSVPTWSTSGSSTLTGGTALYAGSAGASVGTSAQSGLLNVVDSSGEQSLNVTTSTFASSTYMLQVMNPAPTTNLSSAGMTLFAVGTTGLPYLPGTSTVSIGGSPLASTCASAVTIVPYPLNTLTDVVETQAQTDPGNAFWYKSAITATGNATSAITTYVCDATTATPSASKYNLVIMREIGN